MPRPSGKEEKIGQLSETAFITGAGASKAERTAGGQQMKRTFVATLMAGVDGTEHYGVDENGTVFLVGEDGEPYEVPETVAEKVRKSIQAGGGLKSTLENGK